MEKIEEIKKAWADYINLSKLLFSGTVDIYNINALDEKNEFYAHAKELAEEMEISWEKMSHEDSNRIMLAMLEDYYNFMRPEENEGVVVKIDVEIRKKNAKS